MSYPSDHGLYLLLPDGYSCTEFEFDFSGQLLVTGYDAPRPDNTAVAHRTGHGLERIRELHELTGAIIALAEGRQ